MPGRLEFEFRFNQPQMREASHRGEDSPMRILLMGDFSGRANRGIESPAELSDRPIVAVDIEV
jgi:predicted component of type VI protein secretion system